MQQVYEMKFKELESKIEERISKAVLNHAKAKEIETDLSNR